MSEVFELRQYTLHPGKRDTLIELFEREFLETQEACGMQVVGQFRDLDDPDRFVWFRGFPDMPRRKDALTCFYGGAVWKANRDAANATMIDSDDVLLLRLVEGSAFPVGASLSRYYITVYSFDAAMDDMHVPALTLLQTETAENNYPALPVRTGDRRTTSRFRMRACGVCGWNRRRARECSERRTPHPPFGHLLPSAEWRRLPN